jgi:hypothetical protein
MNNNVTNLIAHGLNNTIMGDALFNITWIVAFLLKESVTALLQSCVLMIGNSPEPNLTSLWYRSQYHLMMQIGGYVSIAIALCAAISAVARGGLREVFRTFVIGIPLAVFGGVAAIAMVTLLQKIDMDMSAAMLNHAQPYFNTYLGDLEQSIGISGGHAMDVGTGFLESALLLVILLSTLLLWLEMVFRQLMIYMAVLFIPLAFAAFVWPATREWLMGLIQITIVVILGRFIVCAVMMFGFISIHEGLHAADGPGQILATLAGGLITIVVASASMPALITFVMAPDHPMVFRKDIQHKLPIGADNSYGRGKIAALFRNLRGRIGGGP